MEDFLWVEKYRPKTIGECVLPSGLKQTLSEFVSKGDLPNMILSGGPGVGKTTAAKAMLDQLGLTYMFINGSEESGIDVLRTKIKNFASTVSLHGGRKYLILDEADYLNPQSTQPALRAFIEEFSANCRFILTCNFRNRIIEPLHSRCAVVEFNIPKKDMPALCKQFMDRCKTILKEEGISYDEPVLAELIMKHMPDWRRVLNELQRYGSSGNIDTGILVQISDVTVKELIGYLREKNFRKMRQWVTDNMDSEPAAIFRKIYDSMDESVEPTSIPQVVLILADYQYKNAFAADHELNLVACLTELMTQVKFK